MAGASTGERLIGWYGGVAEKNLSTRPDFVRNWLMLGFQAMRGKAQELLVYATTQRALHVLRRGEGLAGREPRGRQACDEGRGQGERGL